MKMGARLADWSRKTNREQNWKGQKRIAGEEATKGRNDQKGKKAGEKDAGKGAEPENLSENGGGRPYKKKSHQGRGKNKTYKEVRKK